MLARQRHRLACVPGSSNAVKCCETVRLLHWVRLGYASQRGLDNALQRHLKYERQGQHGCYRVRLCCLDRCFALHTPFTHHSEPPYLEQPPCRLMRVDALCRLCRLVCAVWRIVCAALGTRAILIPAERLSMQVDVRSRGVGAVRGTGVRAGMDAHSRGGRREVDAHGHALSGATPWSLGCAGTQRAEHAKAAAHAATGQGDRRRDHRG